MSHRKHGAPPKNKKYHKRTGRRRRKAPGPKRLHRYQLERNAK